MPQKIYDIIPPEVERKLKFQVEKKKISKIFFLKKQFLICLTLLILIGFGFYFFIPTRAEIDVWPKTKLLDFQTQIIVDKTLENSDFSKNLILGRVVEVEKTVSQNFPASGKTLKRAEGKIRLYNRYTTWDEDWREGTRFISGDGKLFRSKSEISVPGAKMEKGKLISSFTDVEVIAAEPGPDYNIGPTNFSIYVYRGTPRYAYYWGESLGQMSGGGEISQVTEKDLETAEEILSEKAISESEASLIKELPEDFVLLEELIESEIVGVSPLAEVNQELESFIVQVKAESKSMGFKKSDLNQFARTYVLSNISPDQELYSQSLNIKYFPSLSAENGEKDVEKAELVLNLDLSAEIYSKVEINFLKRQVLGRGALEAKRRILKNFPEIDRIKIKFWPFWVKKAPLDIKNIKVNLNFE